ncbi:DUF2913 family protein [Photobacterium damselae]|uniref:DUF2913 family protein n=1 Tax=Photobacterium damselae TaxID=38293 RepID=UPI0040686B58
MDKTKYHALLSELIENSLLHLYGQVSASSRFVPTHKRNEILVRFLKPKVKQPQFKLVKTEIKRMLDIARASGTNLEIKLIELNKMAEKERQTATDAHHLFEFLNHIYQEHGFDSKLFNPDVETIPEVIYILQEHIDNCFSNEGQQVAPISLLIETDRLGELVNLIEQSQYFSCEVKENNKDKKQAHILLHPKA